MKTLCAGRRNTAIWRKTPGGDYLVEFGEFYMAAWSILTNPEAYDWFKDVIERT